MMKFPSHELGLLQQTFIMSDLREDLAEYVGVLSESAAATRQAEDRASYMQHLAAAALLFYLVQKGTPREALAKWLADERHSYGWGMLAGDAGRKAEAAFEHFAKALNTQIATL